MENFFSQNKGREVSLNNQYDNLKENYQKIFIEAAESIRAEVNKLKPENVCTLCALKDCNADKNDIFTEFPSGCKLRDWQLKAVSYLAGEYKQKLKNMYSGIMAKKGEYSCSKCAECCRLSVSEYSYEQLKQRAMRGDKFSKDFVSVFVPYKTEEEARAVNPEYFELLGELVEDTKTYYYYCPKLKDNLCSDYENRPDICKSFPHNPLKLLPSKCSFNAWREDISKAAMLLKAKTDIIEFYKSKLG